MNAHRVNREKYCMDLCGFVLFVIIVVVVAIVYVLFLVKQSTFQSTCTGQHSIWQMIYTHSHIHESKSSALMEKKSTRG